MAIGRWVAIDPVTHHGQSTYAAFDNNPVFWADPSGAATGFAGAVEQHTNGLAASEMGETGSDPDEDKKEWTHTTGGNYTNGTETTTDWQSAVSETTQQLLNEDNSESSKNKKQASTVSSQEKYNFGKGKSIFELTEIVYIEAGEGITGGYGELIIRADLNGAPAGLQNHEVSSAGFAIGGSLGSAMEVFAATKGRIILNEKISGNNLNELFSSTKFVTFQSVSGVLKYTYIKAYASRDQKRLLWTAHLFGGGVVTGGVQGGRYKVEFNE